MRWTAGICVAVLLCVANVGFGQQVGPKVLDRSFQRPGARALGMGGAYLLATDDATAVAWNPAALVNVKRLTLPIELAVRAKNFRVRDITDLIDDLREIRDRIDSENIAEFAAKAIREVRSFALRHGARSKQKVPATLTGSLAPVAGISFGSYGLTLSSGSFSQVQVFVDQLADPDPADGIPNSAQRFKFNVYARGGAVAISSLGLAWGRPLPAGFNFGISLRGVRADFLGFAASAGLDRLDNPAKGDAQGIPFGRVHKNKFTLDVGALWEPPVQPPLVKLRYAAVVRNVIPVKFNLPAKDVNDKPITDFDFDFSFRLNPEIDLGVLAEWGRTIGVLELHNVTSSNGGDMSIHAGIEHWLAGNVFAIRVGYDDDRPVVGLGVNLKVLRIDLASGLKPRERLAVGISLRF